LLAGEKLLVATVMVLSLKYSSSVELLFTCSSVPCCFSNHEAKVNFSPQQEQDKYMTWDGITNRD
jgi:hypothetical protein